MKDDGKKYFGKYRGVVTNNVDPLQQGRVQVVVQDVGGQESNWAMPCSPFAGKGYGQLALPVIGTQVWVEFENGEVRHPICTGAFWGAGELPPLAVPPKDTTAITLQTLKQNGLTISDADGGSIMLKSACGASIIINKEGITLDNGQNAKLTLQSNTVSINDGALEVS